jgi:cation diffusion facilitator family transporter
VKESTDVRGLQLTLAVYVLIFILKIAVYAMSGVMALLAEALHTLTDVFVAGFLLVAALYSRRSADQHHMFGYGRVQNVAALVAATLFISFTSFELYKEAIARLFAPEPVYQHLPLALGVIIASMLIAAAPLIKLLAQKKRGAAAKAQLTELFNDELGLLAALIGILFISWGQPVADPIAAIVVATIIAINAVGLFRENISYLLGRSPGPDFLAHIEQVACSVPGVLGVHELRAEYIGPDTVHAGFHIVVPRGITVEEASRIADEVDHRLHHGHNHGYCVIHIDPADV